MKLPAPLRSLKKDTLDLFFRIDMNAFYVNVS